MRHTNYLLRPLTIDNAKPRDKAYALTDGGGLLLEVLPSGTKTWRFKYHLNGKREKVTIGANPAYTTKQARDRHEELRALVERGESPAKTKQSSMAARKVAESRDLKVRVFARRWDRRDAVLSIARLRRAGRALARCLHRPGDRRHAACERAARRLAGEHQGARRHAGDRRAHPRHRAAVLQPCDPQSAGDDESGAAVARCHPARTGRTPPAPERERAGRVLAQARRPGRRTSRRSRRPSCCWSR